MKRFAAIVTIVVVVLAMSAGTAFASVCAGGVCTSAAEACANTGAMACPDAGTATCPMTGGTMLHSTCGHPMDKPTHDGVAPTAPVDQAAPSTPVALSPEVPGVCGPTSLVPTGDARGAPHLTSVIRI